MDKIEKINYYFKRLKLMKEFTGNLGTVVEEDGKLICYVNNNKRFIKCDGIPLIMTWTAQKYHLNKPICYVFDDINFGNKRVNIYGTIPCEIVLKNCKANSLTININGKCILENMYIIKPHKSLIIVANDIKINNSRIRNYYSQKDQDLDLLIMAKNNLFINNSYLGKLNEKTRIRMYVDNEINIKNSVISADNIKFESPIITSHGYSEINAKTININPEELENIGFYSTNIDLYNEKEKSYIKTLK